MTEKKKTDTVQYSNQSLLIYIKPLPLSQTTDFIIILFILVFFVKLHIIELQRV